MHIIQCYATSFNFYIYILYYFYIYAFNLGLIFTLFTKNHLIAHSLRLS